MELCVVHVKNDIDPYVLVWSHVHHVLVCEKERQEVCVWYIIICEKTFYVYAKNVFRRIYKKLVIVIPSGEGICCLGKRWEGEILFISCSMWYQNKINYFYLGENSDTETKTVIIYDSSERPWETTPFKDFGFMVSDFSFGFDCHKNFGENRIWGFTFISLEKLICILEEPF